MKRQFRKEMGEEEEVDENKRTVEKDALHTKLRLMSRCCRGS